MQISDLKSADEIAALCLDYILKDLPFQDAKINVHRSYVGNYFTSLEMMGISFTLMKVDEELKSLIDMEAESMGLTQHGPSA